VLYKYLKQRGLIQNWQKPNGVNRKKMKGKRKQPESLILTRQAFKRPESLTDVPFHFCPGCHHGIAHRLVAEAIDFFGIQGKTIGVASVGCSVFLYDYFDIDVVEADRMVFTYQGDGDLASIGIAEVVHTANRGENITIIFANNGVYGMTGGQMAPTTLLGQKTTTSPYGRDFAQDGYPIRMAEMLATLEGSAFVARVAVNNPANLMKAKKAVRRAFQMQIEGMGFTFVECILACPTNWSLSAIEANQRVEDQMIPYFPLGILKERKMADYL
jgi:2-oxoglutarate ferredoxin oxidoreductase subunit beta